MLVNRLNTVKMSVFPNLIYSHLNQKQNPRRSLMDTGKQLLKVIWSGAIKPTNANSRVANAAPTIPSGNTATSKASKRIFVHPELMVNASPSLGFSAVTKKF